MAVYALYIPTAVRPVAGVGLERFPSAVVAGRILLQRNDEKRSRVFCIGFTGTPYDRPVEEFPLADETGYMRVFLGRLKCEVPGLRDKPDEEWVVREGGRRGVVQRLPWSKGQERLSVKAGRLSVTPRLPDPRLRSLSTREIRCRHEGCGLIFSARTDGYAKFRDTYMQHGWRMRGSVVGPVFFCPSHVA